MFLKESLGRASEKSVKRCPYLKPRKRAVSLKTHRCNRGFLRVVTSRTVSLSLLWVFVKLARITHAAPNGRHVRCIDIFLRQSIPGDLGKPPMIHDIL